MRHGTCSILLALALSTAASAACAETVDTISITNSSQYPVLGFERVSVESNKSTFSEKVSIFLDKPLLPGASVTVANPVDKALVARGGVQLLRWYWTSNRACMGVVGVDPAGGAHSAATGEPRCKPMPSNDMIILIPGIQAVDAIAAKGDLSGAIFEINAMLRHYPDLPLLLHRRGKLYLQAGLADEAEADFHAEAGNDRGHLFHDQAAVFYLRGEGDDALAAIGLAIEHDPDNIEYLGNRAFLSCLAKDFEQMRKDELAIVALGGPPQLPRGPDCSPLQPGG